MKATLLFSRRTLIADGSFVETVLWRVPRPVPGSRHDYKYRLAFVVRDVCVLRYDNEAGKGDHKHIGSDEVAYAFSDVDQLLADFGADVRRWLDEHGGS